MTACDVLVVGGGAAGLSAALVLTRARRSVVVVDAGAPRNAPAAHLHGFLSRDGMPPTELLATGRREVLGYGGRVVGGTVASLAGGNGSFSAELADGQVFRARRVLVATGLRDELPDVKGLSARWGKDVLHCPYCHGWEVRDRALGVVWNGPDSDRFALLVRQWSDDLVLFAPVGAITPTQRSGLAARRIDIVEAPVSRVLVQADSLTGVELADGRAIARGVLFVPPRFVPDNRVLLGLGADLDADGWVIAGPNGTTSVPGVWVAGNVVNPRAQLITAAAEGSAAAIAINADLVGEDVGVALLDDGARTGPGSSQATLRR